MPDINAQGDVNISGDVVGRDKITSTTNNSTTSNISVGDITGTGIAIGHDIQVTVTQGAVHGDTLTVLFSPVLEKIQALPDGPAKIIAHKAAEGLKAEAEKGQAADEKTVSDWFGFLAQMAPDAWDVAVAAFTGPIAGVSAIFQKVAARAKAEKDAKSAAGAGK